MRQKSYILHINYTCTYNQLTSYIQYTIKSLSFFCNYLFCVVQTSYSIKKISILQRKFQSNTKCLICHGKNKLEVHLSLYLSPELISHT